MTIMRRYTTAGWEDVGISSLLVTTDTVQTITGTKTFSNLVTASNGLNLASGKKLDFDPTGAAGYMMAEAVSATTFTDSLAGDTVFRESNTGRQHFGPATSGGAAQASMLMISDAGVAIGRGTKSFGSGSGVVNLTDATTAPTANATSGVFIYSAGGRGKVRDGVGNIWNLDGAMVVRLNTAYTNATTTLSSTALTSGTLGAGTYVYEVNGAYSSSATTAGLKAAITATGTVTNMLYTLVASTSATATTSGVATASATSLPTTPVVVSAITTNWQLQMTGSITLSTAGTITLQAAASGTGTITLPVGCYMVIRRQA
jgi:hypothetical protein